MGQSALHQRRKAAKAARRKAVVARKKRIELASVGLAGSIRAAARSPITHCLVPTGLFEAGIGNVMVARKLPTGPFGCAHFLVDTFCLGVKDAFYREYDREEFATMLDALSAADPRTDIAPACARKLIRDAVAYAADLGLSPAKDYQTIEALFGDVDAGACTDTFTFGKDGKPLFVNGPHDTPARIRIIARTLHDRLGPGGWDYMLGVPSDDEELLDEEEEDEPDELDFSRDIGGDR